VPYLDNKEEWFDLVTEDGTVTGSATRTQVHGNPSLLHPVVHIHVFDNKGRLLLQKRAQDKKIQPGKWDTAVGGHIMRGEDVPSALLREAEEEIGINASLAVQVFSYVMSNEIESELVYTHILTHEGPFTIQQEELDCVRFWEIAEIKCNLTKNIFTPNFIDEFHKLEEKGFFPISATE